MGKLSGAEKKVVPVGSNWREARHLKTFGTEEFVRVRINFISNRTNTCPMLLFRNKRDGEKCRYGGIGRRTGFRIPRLVRESSSLSTCKYLYNFSRSISQKTLFLIFQLDLLVQVFPSETQNALPSFGRERGSPRAPMSPIVPKGCAAT